MNLENNFVISAEVERKTRPSVLSLSAGVGSVYLINAAGENIQTITVDSVSVPLPSGVLAGVDLGQSPTFVQVPRLSSPSGPFFAANSDLVVTFVGGNKWSQFVALNPSNFQPSESVGVWCFFNGFVVSGMGNMTQASWRSTMSGMTLKSASASFLLQDDNDVSDENSKESEVSRCPGAPQNIP